MLASIDRDDRGISRDSWAVLLRPTPIPAIQNALKQLLELRGAILDDKLSASSRVGGVRPIKRPESWALQEAIALRAAVNGEGCRSTC